MNVNRIWAKIGALVRRRRFDAELDEELRFHLDAQIEENTAAGMSPAEARRVALRDFGGVEPAKEAHRDARGIRWIAEAVQDFRFALRLLRRNPGFTAIAVLTLALGIGANTAIFSVVHVVMLKPLPYPAPENLLQIVTINPPLDGTNGEPRRSSSVESGWAERFRDQSRSFDEIGLYLLKEFNLTGVGEPERIESMLVTANVFKMLGVAPALGRSFLPEEMIDGNDRVAILSNRCWRNRFHADPAILGKTVTLDGNAHAIIGVMPAGFRFLLPAAADPEFYGPISLGRNTQPPLMFGHTLGRLRGDVTIEAAEQEADAICQRLNEGQRRKRLGVELVRVQDELSSQLRTALLVLFGAALCILGIACANLGNLLLARSLARQKELGVRAMLGAGGGRLGRQMLTESVTLAAAGGIAGLLLSIWLVKPIVGLYPGMVPRVEELGPEPALLGFGFVLTLVTGVLVGLIPAWRLSRAELYAAVRQGGMASGGGRRSAAWNNVLVGAEVALAILLVSGAGLLLRSFLLLQNVDPAFRRDHLVLVNFTLPDRIYGEPASQVGFAERLVERVRAVPGVQSVGITNTPPMVGGGMWLSSMAAKGAAGSDPLPPVAVRAITPGFLRAMAIRLLSGRYFERADTERNDVVLLNRAVARRYFGEEDPLGRQVTLLSEDRPFTVVGVVSDIKNQSLESDSSLEVYVPLGALPAGFMTLAVHSTADPGALIGLLRAEFRAADPNLPLNGVFTVEQMLSDQVAPERFQSVLTGTFAGLALLLACVGIYGVIAHGVARRTHEIGVRMALGAEPADVVRLVVTSGMMAPVAGIVVGLGAAFATTPVLGSFLFGVKPHDPFTYAGVAGVLVVVSLVATIIPVWRAVRISPTAALRCD